MLASALVVAAFLSQAQGSSSPGAVHPPVTILFFTASWCQPCKPVRAILDRTARNRPGIRILPVEFDAAPDEAARWGVHEIPVVIVISAEGQVLLRADGASRETLSALEKDLARLIRLKRKGSQQ